MCLYALFGGGKCEGGASGTATVMLELGGVLELVRLVEAMELGGELGTCSLALQLRL